MDLEDDEEADALLRALGVDAVRDAGRDRRRAACCATRPTRELAAMLGLGSRGAPPPMCDLVIVGAGPAGLAAARVRRLRGARHAGDRRGRVRRPGRAPRRGSRTTWASRRGSPAASWPSARRSRRGGFGARLVVPAQAVGLARGRRPLHDRARRRRGGQRPHGDRRHRRPVPQARPARPRALRGRRRLLRRHPGRGAAVRRRPGADRRRRQLGRAGGDVPLPARRELPPDDPRRRSRQVDVALPDRRARPPRRRSS